MARSAKVSALLLLLPAPLVAVVTTVGNQYWHLDVPDVPAVAGILDLLGSATAAGDFDGDGVEDLAIGIPRSDFFAVDDVGSVLVLYGTEGGLDTADSQILRQEGDEEGLEAGDLFGSELAAGNFNGDDYDDLAVGAPMDEIGTDMAAGTVSVFYGSAAGLGGHEIWHQGTTGIAGAPEADDQFGFSLAAGDFDGDTRDDLAVGAPGDSVSGEAAAGLVNVIYGSASGLSSTGDLRLRQGFDGLLELAEAEDRFGYSLASGDFDGDTYDDLAVGAPLEGLGMDDDAGVVHVLEGSGSGLTTAGNTLWMQGTGGILDIVEAFDSFGFSLAAGDTNGDARADLAIGAPGQEVVDTEDGQLHLVFGSGDGLTSTGNLIVNKLTPGVISVSDVEFFAWELTAGDVDGDGLADVVVGTPGQDVEREGMVVAENAGGVHVVHGQTEAGHGEVEWVSLHTAADVAGDVPRPNDSFGSAIAVGDFDGDGAGELAVGVPNRLVSGQPSAGAVVVFTSGIFADGFETGDTAAWSGVSP